MCICSRISCFSQVLFLAIERLGIRLFYEVKTNGEFSLTLKHFRIILLNPRTPKIIYWTKNPVFSGMLLLLLQKGEGQGFALNLAKDSEINLRFCSGRHWF